MTNTQLLRRLEAGERAGLLAAFSAASFLYWLATGRQHWTAALLRAKGEG